MMKKLISLSLFVFFVPCAVCVAQVDMERHNRNRTIVYVPDAEPVLFPSVKLLNMHVPDAETQGLLVPGVQLHPVVSPVPSKPLRLRRGLLFKAPRSTFRAPHPLAPGWASGWP